MRIVPSLQSQRGYLLITVVVMLFLVASIAMLLNYDSSISANTSTGELETARAEYVAQAGMQHALWRAQNNACMGDVTIPATTLGKDNYTASITGAAAGTAYTLTADQDAWIRNDDVTKNNGTTADQHLRFETGKVEQTLTRFDLSSLPADAQINSATAWFYITPSGPGGGAHPEGPVTVHRVTADWTETGATWETMNGNFESSRLAAISAQPVDGIWVSFNLTGQVQAWANGQPNYGILMRSVAEGVHGKYSSREDGGNAPRLEVVVGSGTASPVNIQATGTLADGNMRTLTRVASPALQPSGVYTFQPGPTDGIDAYIWEAQQSNNYGTDDETWVSRTSNNASLSLLKFNMGEIPARSKILSATLSLHNRSGYDSDVPVTAHRITNPWDEDFVTWNNRESGTLWDTAGGDIDPTVFANTNVGPTRWVRYEWEITGLVQGWTDGAYANYGVALATAMASSVGERFDTSDHSDPLRRPSLTVNYSCECGSTCMAPQGAGTIAMVVINPTTLVPADANKKALFESWGYTVDVIGESENQTVYDAKTATSNVFFISETVNSNQVGNKLVNVSIGVVSQDGSYNSDLGFAGGSSWPVSRAINVTDTSHYITAIFPAGPLDIYSAAMEQLAVSGGAAAGLQTLADTSGAGSLVALDKGAALLGGGSAAGRRVMLPVGREGRVNWDYLNGNGRLIVQRALQWGTGNFGAAPAKTLLFVAAGTTPTAQEQLRIDLIESWGYGVTVIDDADNQANFDTAVAANDVVYISETVAPNMVGTKLTNAAIGIVNEEMQLYADLDLGNGIAKVMMGQINIIDNTHSISSGFAPGLTTIVTSPQVALYISTGLAAGAQTLAETDPGIKTSLFTVDAGAALATNGNFAAGRRVQLPWGFDGFDFNAVNADGRTIMQRAIEWAAGSGCGTTTPLLLLVADANNPTAEENARKTLLQTWCYGVSLVTASEPQATYDTFADNYDVVYVPSSVPWADVSGKLKLQPVGVVNEIGTLSAYLGFTSGSSGYTGTVTELTDNSHYITSGLPLGNLALTTTSTSMRHFTNTMGPGFKTLSVRPTQTNPMIMTLNTGDELLWGGQAPDRRLMLPWGGSSTFDVNILTADGETILRRSLEWAGGAGPSPGHIAHWKLDETSGGIAVDSVGGHNGTLPNSGSWTAGQIDGALQFNGTNHYINVPHDDTLSLTTFSISAWIRPDTISGYHAIMYKGASTAEANYHLYTDGDEITLGLTSGGWQYQIPTTSANLVAGQWFHLTTTFDGASGEGKHYLNGSLIHTGTIGPSPVMNTGPLTIGTDPFDEDWVGILDDVRIYNRVLDATEIAALAASGSGGGGGGGGGGGQYVEAYQEWSASQEDQWLVQDLSGFGVPPNTVVEVAITNVWSNFEQWAGARSVGSTLDRRLELHEAEAGGTDALVMHVQTDSNSNIEIYADTTDLIFAVLGYWSAGSFVESWDFFDAGVSGTWADHALNAYGVAPGSVAEIQAHNRSMTTEVQCGVRSNGSSLNRLFDIHEAESGGKDMVTLLVNADTDAGATIEAFTEHGGCDFYLMGHWSTPPGSYFEASVDLGSATSDSTWQTVDLSGYGVPANSVVQITMANRSTSSENRQGVRAVGSTADRWINLHEAEGGGEDLVTFHVKADANSQIQWYHEDVSDSHGFYLMGWWVLN